MSSKLATLVKKTSGNTVFLEVTEQKMKSCSSTEIKNVNPTTEEGHLF